MSIASIGNAPTEGTPMLEGYRLQYSACMPSGHTSVELIWVDHPTTIHRWLHQWNQASVGYCKDYSYWLSDEDIQANKEPPLESVPYLKVLHRSDGLTSAHPLRSNNGY